MFCISQYKKWITFLWQKENVRNDIHSVLFINHAHAISPAAYIIYR